MSTCSTFPSERCFKGSTQDNKRSTCPTFPRERCFKGSTQDNMRSTCLTFPHECCFKGSKRENKRFLRGSTWSTFQTQLVNTRILRHLRNRSVEKHQCYRRKKPQKRQKQGVFQILTAPQTQNQKSGFVRARAFAIRNFWGVIEENRLRNKKVYAK